MNEQQKNNPTNDNPSSPEESKLLSNYKLKTQN